MTSLAPVSWLEAITSSLPTPALNINPKYIEAYEKGESKRKEKEEKGQQAV